jgi:hypothetical protein
VESAAPEKIGQGRLAAIFFLMIFTDAWKTPLGFPPLPPARRRSNFNNGTEN